MAISSITIRLSRKTICQFKNITTECMGSTNLTGKWPKSVKPSVGPTNSSELFD